MTNAIKMFELALASVDTKSPENWKWARVGCGVGGRPGLEDTVRAVVYNAITDALAETELGRREQRAVREEIRPLVIENAHAFQPTGAYLMKNEIAAINKIVLANI